MPKKNNIKKKRRNETDYTLMLNYSKRIYILEIDTENGIVNKKLVLQ